MVCVGVYSSRTLYTQYSMRLFNTSNKYKALRLVTQLNCNKIPVMKLLHHFPKWLLTTHLAQ